MDWTEIITAGIAALGAVGGSALMQSKATAVLQVKLDALRNDVDTLSTTRNTARTLPQSSGYLLQRGSFCFIRDRKSVV